MHPRQEPGPDVDFDVVARSTPGFSGADLANLINEAAIVAVRDDRNTISAADFSEAGTASCSVAGRPPTC